MSAFSFLARHLTCPLALSRTCLALRLCLQWICKHYKRCIRAAREDWQKHVKPWQQPEAWERAVGYAWEPIDFREIANATRTLAQRGELRRLIEPAISINRKGAPTSKEVEGMQERAKSFLEELAGGADALAEDETRRVMAGASGARAFRQKHSSFS